MKLTEQIPVEIYGQNTLAFFDNGKFYVIQTDDFLLDFLIAETKNGNMVWTQNYDKDAISHPNHHAFYCGKWEIVPVWLIEHKPNLVFNNLSLNSANFSINLLNCLLDEALKSSQP